MPDVDVLGPAAQLALADCIRGALHFALSLSEPASVLSTACNARYAIEQTVKKTLALEMRRLNALSKAQLPVELWSNIWQLLSDADRISVSRVCSHWRDMSHSCPSLWKSLHFYTTCHAPLCKCPSCTGSLADKFTNPSGWEIHPYPEHSTNVATVSEALSRSRALPLHLSFDIVPFAANPDVVNFLVESLLPHSARLTSLRLRVSKPEDTSSFLARFDSLPALRILELDAMNDSRHDPDSCDSHRFVTRDIMLPDLEELHLHSPRLMWHDGITVHHPRLRKLTVPLSGSYLADRILRSVPGLVSLRIKFTFEESNLERVLQRLIPALPLTDVEVSGVNKSDSAGWIIPTFTPATRPLPCFSLGLGRWYNGDIPWRLLDDLGEGIHLAFSRTDMILDLRGTDNTGRVRGIWKFHSRSVHSYLLRGLWLPFERTVDLSVDAYDWVELVSRFSHWPRVESLTITFSADADIASVPEDRAQHIHFAVLRSVTVAIISKRVQVTAEHIAAFLRTLRLSAPLEVVRLDGGIRDYDPELFTSLSGRIWIG